ncbi:MAG: hypothetical protein M3R02_28100 [Chloroflexota bacterium]|nr:hypothetical protein [Chloroflexota bacterium]
MRRHLPISMVAVLLAALMVVSQVAVAVAQDASPAAGGARFADTLDLPELQITGTDTGFEGLPEETEAGRYLVTLTNEAEQGSAVEFLQLPEGKTADDLMAAFAAAAPPGPDATPGPGMAEGSPMAGMDESSPVTEEDPLGWIYEAYIAGGVGTFFPGQTAQVIVDLEPGDYAVWGAEPEAPQQPVELTVTGEMPADLPEPSADVTVTATGTNEGYDLEFSGEVAPGQQTLQFVNDSDQPHFLLFLKSPGPITLDQVMQLLQLPEGAAPPPGMPNPEEIMPAAFAATISEDAAEWVALDLEPGYYIVACFIPDRENPQMPHAAEGLIDVIAVGVDEATPTS